MRPFVRRAIAIAHKEVLHIVRDSRAVYLALGLPVVMLVFFGFGISTDIDHIPLAVVDQDQSAASRHLTESLVAGRYFRLVAATRSLEGAMSDLRQGRAEAVVLIPRGFARDLVRTRTSTAQLLVDGSDGTTATIALGAATGIVGAVRFGHPAARPSFAQGPPVRIRFNPELRSSYAMVSGVIVMILAMIASLLSALTIAREWERGNMEQLFATPVGRAEIVVGKLAPYAALGLVQALMVLTLGTWIFDMPIRGSLFVLFVGALLFLLSVLGIGLLVSVTTKNQMLAVQFALVAAYMPVAMLSGFLFPIANMPWWLRAASTAVPGRYFLTMLRDVLLKGSGLFAVGPQLAALGVFAVLILALAVSRFKRRLA